jgi:hypothetical protein
MKTTLDEIKLAEAEIAAATDRLANLRKKLEEPLPSPTFKQIQNAIPLVRQRRQIRKEALENLFYRAVLSEEEDYHHQMNKEDKQIILKQLESAEPRWRPISEAPKDGTEILIACQRENRAYIYVAWHEELDGWWQVTRGTSTVIRNASHWMPLPLPPAPDSEVKG